MNIKFFRFVLLLCLIIEHSCPNPYLGMDNGQQILRGSSRLVKMVCNLPEAFKEVCETDKNPYIQLWCGNISRANCEYELDTDAEAAAEAKAKAAATKP